MSPFPRTRDDTSPPWRGEVRTVPVVVIWGGFFAFGINDFENNLRWGCRIELKNVQECDANGFNSSNAAGFQKNNLC